MSRPTRTAAVTAAVVISLCLAWFLPAGSSGHAPVVRAAVSGGMLGGINVPGVSGGSQLTQADGEIAAAARLGARLVRLEVPWYVMEPRGPGQIEPRPLAFLDRLASDAARSRIRILMMVEGSPCWDSSAPPRVLARCRPLRPGTASSWAPANDAAFGTFTAYLASRYGPELAAIEVWNEPDQSNQHYLAGPHKAAHYASILRAAYTAIKHAEPSVTVLGGSLVGSNGAFLRALYAAGIKGYYDGLAVHYYTLTLAALRSIHRVQVANGDSTPLWLDEFGWSSCWPHRLVEQEQACVSSAIQARNISDTVRAIARTGYVAAAVIYKLQDSRSESFGVLDEHGAAKPSFRALAGALAHPGGAISPVRLSLASSGGQLVASGSAPVGDFMELEAFQGARLRLRAAFTLDRFDRFSLALPRVLGTAGLRVLVYQYGAGPAAAASAVG